MNEERAKRAEEQEEGRKQEMKAQLIRPLLAMIMHHGMHANNVAASGEEAMILHSAKRAAGREACYSGEKLIHSALSVIKNEMLQRFGGGRDQMATKIEVLNLQNS